MGGGGVNQPKADTHAEPLQITGSHLRAVRKAVEHLSLSLGGCLHVVDTFASSKMSADKLNMCENVCVACGKKRTPSSEEVPPPTSLKDHAMPPPPSLSFPFFLEGPLSVARSLLQQLVNKLLGLDARGGLGGWGSSRSGSSSRLLCTKAGRRRCRKLQIRSHYTATNMTGPSAAHYSSSETHSLSVSSNEREQCEASVHCAAEQEAAFP